MKPQFVVDTAAALVFYPTDPVGVITAATSTIYNEHGTEIDASAASDLGSPVSTTIAATVKAGARSLTVASATGITKGAKYLIELSGRHWTPEVKAVSGTTLYLYAEAPFALTTSATLKSYGATRAISADVLDTVGENFRAAWLFTIDGNSYEAQQVFDVVKTAARFSATLDHVAEMHPRILRRLDATDADAGELLRAAWRQMVVPELLSRSLKPERIRDGEQLIPFHVACVNERVAFEEFQDKGSPERWEAAQAERIRIGDVLFSALSWYDEDQDLNTDGGAETDAVVSRRWTR